jgi:hypothetical protein
VLINTIPNPMGVSTSNGVSNMVPSSIPRYKVGLLGVTKAVCEAPLFYVKTMAISIFNQRLCFIW